MYFCNKYACHRCSLASPSRTLYVLVFLSQTQVPKCIVGDSMSFSVPCWVMYIHRQFECYCCVEFDTTSGGLDSRHSYLPYGRTERKIAFCDCHGHSLCIQGLFFWGLLRSVEFICVCICQSKLMIVLCVSKYVEDHYYTQFDCHTCVHPHKFWLASAGKSGSSAYVDSAKCFKSSRVTWQCC